MSSIYSDALRRTGAIEHRQRRVIPLLLLVVVVHQQLMQWRCSYVRDYTAAAAAASVIYTQCIER